MIARKVSVGFAVAVLIVAALAAASPQRLHAQAASKLTADDLFSTEQLQEIRLTMNGKDWQTLKENYRENTYYPANLQWRDLVVRGIGIRSRGTGSRNPFKPAIKVDINRYIDQEFLGLKAIILLNSVQDPSMLHERIAMKFFARMGVPAPRVTHARVFINDEYVGVYALTEAVDKAFLGRVFGRDAHGGVENDGNLFEYEYIDNEEPFVFTYLGHDLAPYAKRFLPRTHESAAPETLYRPIEEMFSMVDYEGPRFEEEMSRYLDLPLFMRHLAVENFLAEWDGILGYFGANNFYLYRFEGTSMSRFIPWDKDYTFYDPYYPVFQGIDRNKLVRHAMQMGAPFDSYVRTLLESADSADAPQIAEQEGDAPPETWLQREIRTAFEQIRDAVFADTAKPYSNDDFLGGVQAMVDFTGVRSRFVRCQVFATIDRSRVGPECESLLNQAPRRPTVR